MKKTGPEAKLLVVDDEPNIRELLSTSLRFAGFEVVAAGNGRDALAAAELHNPDLAVLDVTDSGLVLRELAPGVTEDEVRERTEPDLIVDLQPAPTHG